MLPAPLLLMLHVPTTGLDGVVAPLAGGVLIGAAAPLLLATLGRIAGISGILGGLLSMTRANVAREAAWRASFIAGLLTVGLFAGSLTPEAVRATTAPASVATWLIGGLLVGFGTRLGGGCTSGHGVCGISRFSPRSLVATLTFIATGAATVAVVAAMGGRS